jgi:hypothetical protein
MLMPPARKRKYLIQARCSLTSYPEWRALTRETGSAIADFIFEEILCRWGFVAEIVTDNGSAFIAALAELEHKYGIRHIRISGYNSQANGAVERKHFDVRHSITKAGEGGSGDWPTIAHSVFWAERITIRKTTGMSPYFMVHGVEPIMPMDLAEATYLLPPLQPRLLTEDLIAVRARQLQRRPEDLELIERRIRAARFESRERFMEKYEHTIRDYDFEVGTLVLVRNTAIEKSLNKKTKQRYLGPMVVVKKYPGGAYCLAELDGSVSIFRCAAFRVIPYHPRTNIRYNITDLVARALDSMPQTGIAEPPIDATNEEDTGPDIDE